MAGPWRLSHVGTVRFRPAGVGAAAFGVGPEVENLSEGRRWAFITPLARKIPIFVVSGIRVSHIVPRRGGVLTLLPIQNLELHVALPELDCRSAHLQHALSQPVCLAGVPTTSRHIGCCTLLRRLPQGFARESTGAAPRCDCCRRSLVDTALGRHSGRRPWLNLGTGCYSSRGALLGRLHAMRGRRRHGT